MIFTYKGTKYLWDYQLFYELFLIPNWGNSYRFNFATNGINYNSSKVQNFIKKNWTHLSIGITIDGTKIKHDLNRVYKNSEKGSYDDVVLNIPLWLNQFPTSGTKVTISSPDIPYMKHKPTKEEIQGMKEADKLRKEVKENSFWCQVAL